MKYLRKYLMNMMRIRRLLFVMDVLVIRKILYFLIRNVKQDHVLSVRESNTVAIVIVFLARFFQQNQVMKS